MKNKKYVVLALCVMFVLVLSVTVATVSTFAILYTKNNQWENDISISGGEWVANGYLNAAAINGSMLDVYQKGNPYYDYKITNETNHPMSDVVMVFKCEGKGLDNEKWTYKFDVGYLSPGETKSVKVYHWDMYETPDEFWVTSHSLKKVTYKKN